MKSQLKKLALKTREVATSIWKDESAQGATEYILLLVVVVSIAMIFKGRIMSAINGRLGALDSGMNSFNIEGQ
jgi:Flp pilus assembly pilin Flp